jgi:hypothetical protein
MVCALPLLAVITVFGPTTTGEVGVFYDSGFSALQDGSEAIFTYQVVSGSGTLPPGLTLDPDSGALNGTPTSAGTFPFTVRATFIADIQPPAAAVPRNAAIRLPALRTFPSPSRSPRRWGSPARPPQDTLGYPTVPRSGQSAE